MAGVAVDACVWCGGGIHRGHTGGVYDSCYSLDGQSAYKRASCPRNEAVEEKVKI
jgi:hypothetical protein